MHKSPSPRPSPQRREGVEPRPQAVIFDLDGTLVDTVDDIAVALNLALAELSLPAHSHDTVRTMVGGGLGKLLERAVAAHDQSLDKPERLAAVERLLAHYAAKPADLSQAYPSAGETLTVLREHGVLCGVCTNKPHAISHDVLRALGLARHFGFIQGAEDGLPKKPDPSSIYRVLEALKVAPSQAVMVGDSVTDVDAARAAGLAAVILVSYGYTSRPAAELGADAVIDSLAELPQTLAGLAGLDERET